MAQGVRPQFLYQRTAQGDAVEAYYGYLEARDLDLQGAALGPSGAPAPRGFPTSDELSRRLRLSVIRVLDFVRIAPHFEEVPVAGASDDQRVRRLSALVEHLEPTPLEILDIHLPPRRHLGHLLQVPAVGGWSCVAVGDAARMDGRLPVLIGDPDEDSEDRLRSLLSVRRVTEEELVALRRVFSLAHIGDLDDGGAAGFAPEGGPRPPFPYSDGRGPAPEDDTQHIRIFTVSASKAVVAETEPAVVDNTGWPAQTQDAPGPQYVHITEG